jgi:hypothetical protein
MNLNRAQQSNKKWKVIPSCKDNQLPWFHKLENELHLAEYIVCNELLW